MIRRDQHGLQSGVENEVGSRENELDVLRSLILVFNYIYTC
jgi:hypothetical protein